jgi:DNA-binding FadR family transcriptional regulator
MSIFASVPGVDQMKKASRHYQDVLAGIREAIRAGTICNDRGHLPSERELSEQFLVSRAPVRQALTQLEESGEIIRNGRARVVPKADSHESLALGLTRAIEGISRSTLAFGDVREARAFLERSLVRHAARHSSPRDLDRLGIALAANQAALNDPDEFARTDAAFHQTLADLPRNPVLSALHAMLADLLADEYRAGLRARARNEDAFVHHVAVFRAISAGDADEAERQISHHLSDFALYYVSLAPDEDSPPQSQAAE